MIYPHSRERPEDLQQLGVVRSTQTCYWIPARHTLKSSFRSTDSLTTVSISTFQDVPQCLRVLVQCGIYKSKRALSDLESLFHYAIEHGCNDRRRCGCSRCSLQASTKIT